MLLTAVPVSTELTSRRSVGELYRLIPSQWAAVVSPVSPVTRCSTLKPLVHRNPVDVLRTLAPPYPCNSPATGCSTNRRFTPSRSAGGRTAPGRRGAFVATSISPTGDTSAPIGWWPASASSRTTATAREVRLAAAER